MALLSSLTLARIDQPELLDQGIGSRADVHANLTEMWRSNRYLGGMSALTRHLYSRLRLLSGPVRLLDLGSGSAQIPRAVTHWARRHGIAAEVIAADWSARNLLGSPDAQHGYARRGADPGGRGAPAVCSCQRGLCDLYAVFCITSRRTR